MQALKAVLLSAVLALVASAADVSGTWSGSLKVTGPDGQTQDDTIHLTLKQDGGKLTGTAGPRADEQLPIEKGTIDGNNVTMEVPYFSGTFKFAVVLEGDHLKGDVAMSAGGQTIKAKMDATRAK